VRLRDVAETQRARVQKVLDEQKAALRERKQILNALVQEQTKLLTLRRDYKRNPGGRRSVCPGEVILAPGWANHRVCAHCETL